MNKLGIPTIFERCQQGDHEAFRELVERYRDMAYTLAMRILGTHPEAEDAVQDSFAKIWKHMDSFKSDGNFKAWLARIVTNTCLDHRKTYSRRFRQFASKDFELDNLPAETENPSETTSRSELLQAIQRLAATLPRRQATIFVLRDLQDLRMAEVAQVMGISENAGKSSLYHARRKIRHQLWKIYNLRDRAI